MLDRLNHLDPPETEPFSIQIGNVMYEDVRSMGEVSWLREHMATREQRLTRLLTRNDFVLRLAGVHAKAVIIDRHNYYSMEDVSEEDMEAAREPLELLLQRMGKSTEGIAHSIEKAGSSLVRVDPSTEYRAAANLGETNPCDPDHTGEALYVVIYNGPDPQDHSAVRIGSREFGESDEPDTYSNEIEGMPEELWFTMPQVQVVGSCIDVMKRQMAAKRLPDLGESGYYDTLVATGSAADQY